MQQNCETEFEVGLNVDCNGVKTVPNWGLMQKCVRSCHCINPPKTLALIHLKSIHYNFRSIDLRLTQVVHVLNELFRKIDVNCGCINL